METSQPGKRAGPLCRDLGFLYILWKKTHRVYMARRAGSLTEISPGAAEISASGLEKFSYKHASPVSELANFRVVWPCFHRK